MTTKPIDPVTVTLELPDQKAVRLLELNSGSIFIEVMEKKQTIYKPIATFTLPKERRDVVSRFIKENAK